MASWELEGPGLGKGDSESLQGTGDGKSQGMSTIRALPALQCHRQAEDGEPWSVREGCGPQDAGRVLPPLLHPPHGATEQGSWDGEGWASQQERESFHGPPRPGLARPTLRSPRRGQGPRPGVRSGGAVGTGEGKTTWTGLCSVGEV